MFDREQVLAPGASVRAYWALNLTDVRNHDTGQLVEHHDVNVQPSGFTNPTSITVRYAGRRGRARRRSKFVDTYDIHLFAKGMAPVGSSGIKVEDESIKTLSKKVGELTRAVNMTRWEQ